MHAIELFELLVLAEIVGGAAPRFQQLRVKEYLRVLQEQFTSASSARRAGAAPCSC